jgi:hypothetical protein
VRNNICHFRPDDTIQTFSEDCAKLSGAFQKSNGLAKSAALLRRRMYFETLR